MSYRLEALFLLLFVTISTVFAEKKARVITESGKKWDVLFLRMSNDTIYLKARKPNGTFFSISGHKSKFRKIEFLDGSQLNLASSNFQASETHMKSYDTGEYGTAGDSTQGTLESAQPIVSDWKTSNNRTDSAAAAAHYLNPKQDTASSTANYTDSGSFSGFQASDVPKPMDTASQGVKPQLHNEKNVKPIVMKKKKSHALGFSVCLLSVATLAGSAASYYFFIDDHKKSQEAYGSLENASVLGAQSSELLNVNKSKHEAAQEKLKISQILLGVGSALLAGGIILYF